MFVSVPLVTTVLIAVPLVKLLVTVLHCQVTPSFKNEQLVTIAGGGGGGGGGGALLSVMLSDPIHPVQFVIDAEHVSKWTCVQVQEVPSAFLQAGMVDVDSATMVPSAPVDSVPRSVPNPLLTAVARMLAVLLTLIRQPTASFAHPGAGLMVSGSVTVAV